MKKHLIGYRVPVRSNNPKHPGRRYSVFFSRLYPHGLCDCPWGLNHRNAMDGQCQHIAVAAASIRIEPRVAEPVYSKYNNPYQLYSLIY